VLNTPHESVNEESMHSVGELMQLIALVTEAIAPAVAVIVTAAAGPTPQCRASHPLLQVDHHLVIGWT